MSQDTVGLFLEEAIALGYCERDSYDKSCYYSVSEPKTLLQEAFRNNPYKRTFEKKATNEGVKEKQQLLEEESVTKREPTRSLPSSPRVKMSIADTIMGYITECQPKTFSIQDVVNYLYSPTQQQQWSGIQRKQIITSISNSLRGTKEKQWKRIKPGVYQPLLTPEQGNSVSTITELTHILPPSPRVKMTVPDTIMGYITECQPTTFTVKDILNYLYSETEQASWSKQQKTQIINSIAGRLSYYNKRNWQRVRTGVYRPLNHQ